LLEDTRKSNDEALKVLQENGIKLVNPTPSTRAELQNNYRQMTAEKLINDAFSKSIYEEVMKHLGNYHKEMPVNQ
jgi:TRAP-type mannitol/chloroaromatic compound transport system substrate-binding protein